MTREGVVRKRRLGHRAAAPGARLVPTDHRISRLQCTQRPPRVLDLSVGLGGGGVVRVDSCVPGAEVRQHRDAPLVHGHDGGGEVRQDVVHAERTVRLLHQRRDLIDHPLTNGRVSGGAGRAARAGHGVRLGGYSRRRRRSQLWIRRLVLGFRVRV